MPDTDTVMNWSLGTPNNGLQTSAHSGTNAWGSNLYGQSLGLFEYDSTFLYSPAIDLSGLSQATLTFWHCFDFNLTTSFEEGQVLICTNTSADPNSLPLLYDFSYATSDDWTQANLDLSAYVGKTIQVVWDYAGYDIGGPMYGWLVDDVSITGIAAGSGGTITITKNLGQGTWTLTGPVSQTGTAPSATITNAPPGPYTVQFSDVAFYQTPLDQSNNLTAAGSRAFTGNYTFIDANHNGISDAWEKWYFGSVTTSRTEYTDTDGDGMSDYAEFIAGTDPTNAASKLVFLSATLQTNQMVQLHWAAIPGRLYQVLTTPASTNFSSWVPISDWLQASGSPMSYTTTNASQGSHFYRVQVRP